MRISYAITVCNEFVEVQKLLQFILDRKRDEDEVVVLFDKQAGTAEVWAYLQKLNIKVEAKSFKNHFADWKNYLTSLCEGDPDNEVFLVPRVNTVEGLTQDHIDKWRWNVNEQGWVNWPDYQWRIYKNSDHINWTNKVHEKLEGFKLYAPLPQIESFSLYHPKDIKRQEKQNTYYDTL